MWFVRRWKSLIGAGDRIVGLDIARGLAVLGMFAVHVGDIPVAFNWGDPNSWAALTWGNSSATFAVLAGIAVAIISGGSTPAQGDDLVRARMRILTRAVLVFLVGGLLIMLNSEAVVIIEFYAVYFAMSLPFLRWKPWALLLTGGLWMVVAPMAKIGIESMLQFNSFANSMIVELMVTGFYPALTWFAYTLVGLGLGRLALRSWAVRLSVLAAGIVLVVAGRMGGPALQPLIRGGDHPGPLHPFVSANPSLGLQQMFSPEGHTGTTFDFLSSTGVALIVIALCLIAERVVRWVLFPIAAVGSMSLTAYSGHVIALWLEDGQVPYTFDRWLTYALVAIIACTIWRLFFFKGPLEWAMSRIATWASGGRRRRSVAPHPAELPPIEPVGPVPGSLASQQAFAPAAVAEAPVPAVFTGLATAPIAGPGAHASPTPAGTMTATMTAPTPRHDPVTQPFTHGPWPVAPTQDVPIPTPPQQNAGVAPPSSSSQV